MTTTSNINVTLVFPTTSYNSAGIPSVFNITTTFATLNTTLDSIPTTSPTLTTSSASSSSRTSFPPTATSASSTPTSSPHNNTSLSSTSSTPPSSASNDASPTSTRSVNIGVGGVVGALFGGLIAGALIVVAAFLFFRYRRRTKNLVAANGSRGYASASPWEGEKKGLLVQLNEVQAERAQLRTYLDLADTQDPRDVVELFDKLNVSVRNSCLLASTAVLKSVQLKSSWTTADASSLKQLQQDLDGARGLVLSERGAGRRPEEFLPEAFRYIVNLALIDNLFGLFHPGVSEDENKLLLGMYRDIRRRDPQRLAARWRCLTYSAIDNRMPPSSNWSSQFADNILIDLSSIVSSLFGETPIGLFPAKFRGELASIGTEAYKWNRSAKSTFKALDFRPVLFTSADPFDPASMTLYMDHKPEKLPRNIIVGVSLALMSTSAVLVGDEMREEYVWQTKADVLTEGFFG